MGWKPVIKPRGAGGSGSRSGTVPVIQAPEAYDPTWPIIDDDFTGNTISPVANVARWRVTAIVGTGYTAPLWTMSQDHVGVTSLRSQGAGGVTSLDQETSYPAGNNAFSVATSGNLYMGFRLALSGFPAAVTSCNAGWGQVGNLAYGVDWITDPDAVFTPLAAGGSACTAIFHYAAAAYSGAAAGEIWFRFYEQAGNQAFRVATSVTAAEYHKYEVYFDPNTVSAYVDGTFYGSALELGYGATNARLSAQIGNTGGSARIAFIDWVGLHVRAGKQAKSAR